MERCENIPELADMLRVHATGVVVFKEPSQTLVKGTGSFRTATCHVAHVKS